MTTYANEFLRVRNFFWDKPLLKNLMKISLYTVKLFNALINNAK